MIPLKINQLKEFFKFPWDNFMFKQILPGLESVGDTFRRTMTSFFNFFTMVYMDDFIICFKDDKECLAYLRRIFVTNRVEKQGSKKKHQGEHGFSENSYNNPDTMLSNGGNYVFCLQELNGQKMLGYPFEYRMLKHQNP